MVTLLKNDQATATAWFHDDAIEKLGLKGNEAKCAKHCFCLSSTKQDALPPEQYVGEWKSENATLTVEANGRLNYQRTGTKPSPSNTGFCLAGWREPPETSSLHSEMNMCLCFHLPVSGWKVEKRDRGIYVVAQPHAGEMFERVESTPATHVEIERA